MPCDERINRLPRFNKDEAAGRIEGLQKLILAVGVDGETPDAIEAPVELVMMI